MDQVSAVQLKVSGMHCSHCRSKVEQALQKVPGVQGASVDLEEGVADVDFDPKRTQPDALVTAVVAAGYAAQVSE